MCKLLKSFIFVLLATFPFLAYSGIIISIDDVKTTNMSNNDPLITYYWRAIEWPTDDLTPNPLYALKSGTIALGPIDSAGIFHRSYYANSSGVHQAKTLGELGKAYMADSSLGQWPTRVLPSSFRASQPQPVCISLFWTSENKAGDSSLWQRIPGAACIPPPAPIGACEIQSGDVIILDHGKLSAGESSRVTADFRISCNVPTTIGLLSGGVGRIKLAGPGELYSSLRFNDKLASEGIVLQNVDAVGVPVTVSSEIISAGNTTPGVYSGSTVMVLNIP